jgi:hypothetical protein
LSIHDLQTVLPQAQLRNLPFGAHFEFCTSSRPRLRIRNGRDDALGGAVIVARSMALLLEVGLQGKVKLPKGLFLDPVRPLKAVPVKRSMNMTKNSTSDLCLILVY